MCPEDLEDEVEDLKNLVSWGLPGYAQSMAATKGSTGKKSGGAKKAARKTTTKSSKNK